MLYLANRGWSLGRQPMFVIKGTKSEIDNLANSFRMAAYQKGGTHIEYSPVDVIDSVQAFNDLMDEKVEREYKQSIRGRIMEGMIER